MDYGNIGSGALAFAALFVFFGFIIAIGYYVLSALFLSKIFDKAGVQGRWRAWVPVYNFMVFSKLGDLNPWLILYAVAAAVVLGWIPVIGYIIVLLPLLVTLLAAWRVGLKLQKEAVWLILYFFVSIVWLGVNAYDKSRWNTAIPASPWAGNTFMSDTTVWEGVPSQVPAGGFPANPVTHPGYPPAPGYPQPPAPGYQAPPAQGHPQPPAPGSPQPPAGPTPPPAGPTPPPAGPTPPPPATPQPPVVPPSSDEPPAPEGPQPPPQP